MSTDSDSDLRNPNMYVAMPDGSFAQAADEFDRYLSAVRISGANHCFWYAWPRFTNDELGLTLISPEEPDASAWAALQLHRTREAASTRERRRSTRSRSEDSEGRNGEESPDEELRTPASRQRLRPTPEAVLAEMNRAQRGLLLWVLTRLEADGPKTDRELLELWLTIRPRDVPGYKAAVYRQLTQVTRRAEVLGLVEMALTDDSLGWGARPHWRERLQELIKKPNTTGDV